MTRPVWSFATISRRCRVIGAAVFVTVLVSGAARAEDPLSFKPADTSSPRATLRSFIQVCNEIDHIVKSQKYIDRAAPKYRPIGRRLLDCLDASELPEFSRTNLAGESGMAIKEVLDRIEVPPWDEIPDVDTVQSTENDGKPLMLWRVPGSRIAIGRVMEGPQTHEYLFTTGTVGRAVDYYKDMKSLPCRTTGPPTSPGLYDWYVSAPASAAAARVIDSLPDWVKNRWKGMAVWQWIFVAFSIVFGFTLMGLFYWLQQRVSHAYKERARVLYYFAIVFPVLALATPLAVQYIAHAHLAVRGLPAYVLGFAVSVVQLLALVVLVFAIVNRVVELLIAAPHINPQGVDAQFIRIISKIVSLTISVIILLEGGQYLGIPVTTLLASAGVGGLAVALAAQDTLKNLFGTITLMADKPFRVGERIVIGDYDGFVESFGLRSTRIRLLDGHLVTVPNDELARKDIENVSQRPYIKRVANIRLPLQTSGEKLELAVQLVRDLLANHEGMDAERPPRVYFNDYKEDAFNLLFIYWYHPADYWKAQEFADRLNLQICQAFDEHGLAFVLPTPIAYTSAESITPKNAKSHDNK